jgi:hypothetical protein
MTDIAPQQIGFLDEAMSITLQHTEAADAPCIAVMEVKPIVTSQMLGNAAKLREIGQKLEVKANESLTRNRQTNTARRVRQAESAERDARRELEKSKTILRLADALEAGELVHLQGLRTKVQIETLLERLNYAKQGAISAKDKSYSYYESQKGRPATEDDCAFATWPDASGNGWRAEAYKADIERLTTMGITNLEELKAALRELVPYASERIREDPIKKAERDLVGLKIPGFFPTPPEVIDRMLSYITPPKPFMRFLEPSAGSGRIADAILGQPWHACVHCCEVNPRLQKILEAKQHELIATDFMEFNGEYDYALMNPPFEDGQDIEHVRHAYDCLKHGGRMVAIMSPGPFFRSDRKSTAFREWFDTVGGVVVEDLPSGTFKESGTSIASKMIVIDKE